MTDVPPRPPLLDTIAVRIAGRDLAVGDLAYLNRMTTVGQVLPNVAHELNNALQVIGGVVELLGMQADLPADAREKMARISVQSNRATEMLRDLVTFARRDDGGIGLVDPSKVVEKALFFRRYHLARARIAVAVESVEPARTLCRTDPHDLQQILLNLIINAEQSLSGRSDGRIGIVVARSGSNVEVSVTDNGAGLPDAPERAVQPFFTTKVLAAGLGLTVAEALARWHAGELRLGAAPGGGTVAAITMPAA
jgi:C4-dicarboxylate-specific signal transduction histidine kinase